MEDDPLRDRGADHRFVGLWTQHPVSYTHLFTCRSLPNMLLIIIGASYYQDGDIAAPIVCFLVTVILLPDDSAPEDTDLG